MALIDDEPPITLPRAHSMRRPFIPGSGSEKYIQSCMRLMSMRPQPSGMWIQGSRSQPPASSTSTRPSSLSRFASVQPAEPAPTIMKSYSAVLSECGMAESRITGSKCGAAADHVGGFLGDHNNHGVDVAADQVRHDRGVDDAQGVDAAHAEFRIDDRIGVAAHAAGADRVIDGDAGCADVVVDLRIGLQRRYLG